MFWGSYDHTVDKKGRVALPAQYREILTDTHGSELFLTAMGGQNVTIYPLAVWKQLQQKLSERPRMDENVEQFLSLASYFGQQSGLDSQGRILVPPRLRDHVGISREVTILGKNDSMEIWDRDQLAEHMARIEDRFDDVKRNLGEMGI